MPRLRIAACQMNTVVGDLDGNLSAIVAGLEAADAADCDIAVFPELALTGYPPEDLVLKPGFISDNLEALEKLAARTGRCAAVVGFVDAGRDLYNAAAVCALGSVQGVYHKRLLPNYAVFDEQRYFAPGVEPLSLFRIAGVRVGVSICEDAWSPTGPIASLAEGGAELVVNINASPYYAGRLAERERMLATRAADASSALVYVNQVGGQDELVFDGASLVIDPDGDLVARGPQFTEHQPVVDVDALGAEHVHGVSMPSRYSSEGSKDDAQQLADALGIDFRVIPIEPAHTAFLEMLRPSFGDLPEDLAEENIQSRARGVTLMALSNKFGWLVLATGNKSEMATGFSTIYGDMVGGYAVIKDVTKTLVFELCCERNRRGHVIPEAVLTKPPSAELRPGQRDDQSLPQYDVLDPILEAYVEADLTSVELVEAGFDEQLVARVVRLVDLAEYKRRQSPPGVRVTPK